MGCNSGKASPPGAELRGLINKPQDATPLLLGSEDQSASKRGNVSMVTEPADASETQPSQIEEATELEPNRIQELPAATPQDENNEPHAVETPKKPSDDLHSACHFSPLSIVGVWQYDGREQGSTYEIVIHGDSLQVKQVIDKEMHLGTLRADGEWLVGRVFKADGKDIGTIRLQHQSGKLLSNFKVAGGDWGVDLLASKTGPPSSPMKEAEPTMSVQQSLKQRGEEKMRMAMESRSSKANAQANGTPESLPALPAITTEDVGRAGEAAAARANGLGQPARREKGMCCC